MKMMPYENAKTFLHNHGGKIALGVGTVALMAMSASADVTTAVTNGSAIISGGISVARTEPLNWIIEAIAIAIGAVAFVKLVKRLY